MINKSWLDAYMHVGLVVMFPVSVLVGEAFNDFWEANFVIIFLIWYELGKIKFGSYFGIKPKIKAR